MLVVIGIIILISAISLPVFLSLGKGGKLRQAKATVTGACLVARSRAIRERRKFSVTLLERPRKCVIITDYSRLENILPLAETGDCDIGSASDTLVGDSVSWTVNEWEGYYATLSSGDGIGQQRLIKSNTATTLTVDTDWVETTITGWTAPESGNEYLIGGKTAKVVCPHQLNNFDLTGSDTTDQKVNRRYDVLAAFAIGGVRELPEGVSLDLDDNSGTYDPRSPQAHAWTWIFLPTGAVITLDTDASNQRNEHWHETTYMDAAGVNPIGPRIYGPQDEQSATIIVYAMTGQAQSK